MNLIQKIVLFSMVTLRDYQIEISELGYKQILIRGWCYLAMEVRTGKTYTALNIAKKLKGKTVFVTKKKAIQSIKKDALNIGIDNITVINYQSLHKVDTDNITTFILDEAHFLGSFPKPSKSTKQLKGVIKKANVIFLSGTPTPESFSQIFHQMYVLGSRGPFKGSFYKWANDNVIVSEKFFGHGYPVKDYSNCTFDVSKLDLLSYTQKQSGFKSVINEHFMTVDMLSSTKHIIKKLRKDKIVEGSSGVVLADTAVKEMQKIHQISSGTVLLEDESKGIIIDESKAIYISEAFKDKKIAIFYKFKAELDLLKIYFDITQEVEEFNTTSKTIALQFVSGREGINLSKADCIVSFNIDFSATTYFQFRDRLTTIDRKQSDVFWIFSDCGIEKEIYNTVINKKKYTSKHYERATLPN